MSISPAFAQDPAAIAALAAMRARLPNADPLARLPDIHPCKIPRHIAIIMDGNGRWAKARDLDRRQGHRAGADSIRRTLNECGKLGVEQLTLYSFSNENWKRPIEEVTAIMELFSEQLSLEAANFVEQGVRFRAIGSRERIPFELAEAIDAVEQVTASQLGITLCLALNYGSRAEIVDAAKALATRVAKGELRPGDITEDLFAAALYTAGMPDPDLLIRTAGEMRVSNYLLWQISYAELHVTDVLWPDFGVRELHTAIRDFAGRTRKFGGLA